jgi:hypothetical protein
MIPSLHGCSFWPVLAILREINPSDFPSTTYAKDGAFPIKLNQA